MPWLAELEHSRGEETRSQVTVVSVGERTCTEYSVSHAEIIKCWPTGWSNRNEAVKKRVGQTLQESKEVTGTDISMEKGSKLDNKQLLLKIALILNAVINGTTGILFDTTAEFLVSVC